MFTGLIDAIGQVDEVRDTPEGREITIDSGYADLALGESVACNGVCLTVRECRGGRFAVAAVTTTLERTAIAQWRRNTRLNLERAMPAAGRFGGHIVQGHVDGVGDVTRVTRHGDATLVDILAPRELLALMVPLGSVAVDGVSLTVNALPAADQLQISLIEYTLSHTTLGDLGPGERVHLECDIVAKYVQRLLRGPVPSGP